MYTRYIYTYNAHTCIPRPSSNNMASSSSSSTMDQQNPPNMYKTTSAPPPTPSTNLHNNQPSVAADALSRLLQGRLMNPPTLSLPTPTRRKPLPAATCPPLLSLSSDHHHNDDDNLLSVCTRLGYFQLTNHHIPSYLANSAELECLSLFELSKEEKETHFPKNWPLGYEENNKERSDESFWLDESSCLANSELGLSSLRQLAEGLDKLGLEVVENISRVFRVDNPFKEADPARFCSLIVVHRVDRYGNDTNRSVTSDGGGVVWSGSGGFYPYVVGLHYQTRGGKYSLLSDSGWETVETRSDSVLVTVGDIAQVWTNGKSKKVRGTPMPCIAGEATNNMNNKSNVTMSLLLTLPLESTVAPLNVHIGFASSINQDEEHKEHIGTEITEKEENGAALFCSFSFEDYAWRTYHEPYLIKEPLDRYRIM